MPQESDKDRVELMEEVTLLKQMKVNDQLISIYPGDSYYDSINRAGIYIPTLCHEPELKPSGACRICSIEIEGSINLVASSGRE